MTAINAVPILYRVPPGIAGEVCSLLSPNWLTSTFNTQYGIVPVNLFWSRYNFVNCVSCSICVGIVPIKLLRSNWRFLKLVSDASCVGIVPDKLLRINLSETNLESDPS